MTAGRPNYLKLFEMGKLPDSARQFIPWLSSIDVLQDKLCPKCLEEFMKIFGESAKKVAKKAPEVKKPEVQTISESKKDETQTKK